MTACQNQPQDCHQLIVSLRRRSPRLFSKFVEKHATKLVENEGTFDNNTTEWIKKQLNLMENTGSSFDFYMVNGMRVNSKKEAIAIGIYSTIIYNEWHFPGNNDKIFQKTKFIDTMIDKLHELINVHGKQWGSKWAIPMIVEFLKIKSKRFGNCVGNCIFVTCETKN